MKICLVGPGYKPIPPTGWGAVESVVWDYYINLKKKNIDVTIINNKNLNQVIQEINSNNYTIVHIMYDDHVVIVPFLKLDIKIFYTSHYAYITQDGFENNQQGYFKNIFLKVIENRNRIHINAISEEIKKKYIKHGFPENKINVVQNGARDDVFDFKENPINTSKSIYLAKIENRKRQYVYQNINGIDFVGNFHNSTFNTSNKNYLGEWDKDKLYKNLSDYGNLILLSDGEADPLVVKEALLCGLGVVISECSAANLDSKDFITIIPNNKLDDIEYVKKEIIKNRLTSIKNREVIRKYGMEKFSWNNVINKYISIINS
jgi:glycosyltransferase involved in cell wall biosynthesis